MWEYKHNLHVCQLELLATSWSSRLWLNHEVNKYNLFLFCLLGSYMINDVGRKRKETPLLNLHQLGWWAISRTWATTHIDLFTTHKFLLFSNNLKLHKKIINLYIKKKIINVIFITYHQNGTILIKESIQDWETILKKKKFKFF